MTGDTGLGATRLGGFEAVTAVARVALGGHGMTLHTGLDLGLGFVGKMRCIHGPPHGQHMAWKTITRLIQKLTMLLVMTTAAHLRRGKP